MVFQQDNDPKHTSKQQHPGSRPTRLTLDLDSVENWWGDIKNAVTVEKQDIYIEKLWTVVQWFWTGVPVHR